MNEGRKAALAALWGIIKGMPLDFTDETITKMVGKDTKVWADSLSPVSFSDVQIDRGWQLMYLWDSGIITVLFSAAKLGSTLLACGMFFITDKGAYEIYG